LTALGKGLAVGLGTGINPFFRAVSYTVIRFFATVLAFGITLKVFLTLGTLSCLKSVYCKF